MSEKFHLKWNDFQPHLATSFSSLRNAQKFADVTLMSDDYHQVTAHRVVLATCSDYFREVLEKSNNSQSHPILCLDGINKEDLLSIIDYVYHGEVQIHQKNLESFIQVSQKLKLHGLLETGDAFVEEKKKIMSNDSHEEPSNNVHDSVISNSYEIVTKSSVERDTPLVLSDEFNSIEELDEKIKENIEIINGIKHCRLCTYQSMQMGHVKEHIEVHFNLSFPCKHCEKTFKKRLNLRQHIGNMHKILKV